MSCATYAVHLAIISRFCGAGGLDNTVFGSMTNIEFALCGRMLVLRMSRSSTITND